MNIDLSGRKIIVTGGASGIGAACVKAYVAANAEVVALDLNEEAGRALVDGLDHGGRCRFIRCNVASKEEVDAAFADAATGMSGLNVLAHLAGVDREARAADITEAQMREMLDIHVLGTLFVNQAAYHLMKDRGGQIINAGSMGGIRGIPKHAHYSASKGAVLAWTRTVAQEWGRFGITVNAIAPWAHTPLAFASRNKLDEEQRQAFDAALSKMIPLAGGLRTPEVGIAPVMLFLASDGANFINGQTLSIDGGVVLLGS